MADGDVVAVADETQPRDPEGAVGRGGDGGPVVLPEFVADGDRLDLCRGGKGEEGPADVTHEAHVQG